MICPEKMGRVVNSMTLQVVSTDECCHNAFLCITILHMELPRKTGFKLTTDTPFHLNTIKSTDQWYLSLAYRECCQLNYISRESGRWSVHTLQIFHEPLQKCLMNVTSSQTTTLDCLFNSFYNNCSLLPPNVNRSAVVRVMARNRQATSH